jgi:hypothetical protein
MQKILAHIWQKINGRWHSCHSWQEPDRRMITAMTTFLILTLVVAAVFAIAAATIRVINNDGRFARPPRSHYEDRRFIAYGAR